MRLHFGIDGKTGHFGHFFLRERIQRRAAENHIVMVDNGEIVDFALDQFAAALDQRAVGFQRLDQAQNAADILDRGFAQAFQVFVGDHGADAVMRKQFQQHRAVDRERHDVGARDAGVTGLDRTLQIEGRIRRQEIGGQHRFGLVRRQFADVGVAHILEHRRFGDENQLFGAQGDGGGHGHVFHGQIEGLAGRRKAQR